MKKYEDLNKGEQIKADLYSRPNFISGRYRLAQLGLDDLVKVKDSDIFFLETLRMKADLADKMFTEAKSQGRDTSDPSVIKELGEEINAIGTPIHRSEAIIHAVLTSLRLIIYYGVAIGFWGLVFKKSFLVFGLYGVIVGILISLLSVAPVIAFQRTKQKIRDMVFGASAMWGNLGIIIGVMGLVVWAIRLIFFK